MKLDDRFRELIAVGASVAANCRPCLRHHVDRARGLGAGAAEIASAIEVGRTVRAGAASALDQVVSGLGPAVPAAAPTAGKGGCCA